MASVITIAGEKLFAAKAQANEQLDIDTFIFANVPAQDATAPINREEGLPTDHVVHQQIVQQVGRINDNVVVYSTVLDSITGPFEFNWVGLYSSINNTLVAINHIPTTPKTATTAGVAGNTLNRNFGIEYSGIADLTGIDVAPETWQLDFTARLQGMDKLTQQLAKDMNGKDSFIDDAFKVMPRSTLNSFEVKQGVGYISGLRVELETVIYLNVDSYPKYVYADAYFEGDATSTWAPRVNCYTSDIEIDDFIDELGREHYLARIAIINAADDVEDLRASFTENIDTTTKNFKTVEDYKAYKKDLPAGKVVYLEDRNAEFIVTHGQVSGNDANLISSNNVTQYLSLIMNSTLLVKSFGGIDNISVDSTNAFKHLFNEVNKRDLNSGVTVIDGEGGWYSIDASLVPTITKNIELKNMTISLSTHQHIEIQSQKIATTTLAASTTLSSLTISVADASGIEEGDIITLVSDRYWDYDRERELFAGETQVATGVSGNEIALPTGCYDAYDMGNENVVVKAYRSPSVKITNVTITRPQQIDKGGLRLGNLFQPKINNTEVSNCCSAGISISGCYEASVDVITLKNCGYEGVSTGYGIQDSASTLTFITTLTGFGNRRAVDFSGPYPSRAGSVNGFHVVGLRGTGSCLGSHGTADGVSISNGVCEGALLGVQLRSPNSTVDNVEFRDIATAHIVLSYTLSHTIKNCTVKTSRGRTNQQNTDVTSNFITINNIDVNNSREKLVVVGNKSVTRSTVISIDSSLSALSGLTVKDNVFEIANNDSSLEVFMFKSTRDLSLTNSNISNNSVTWENSPLGAYYSSNVSFSADRIECDNEPDSSELIRWAGAGTVFVNSKKSQVVRRNGVINWTFQAEITTTGSPRLQINGNHNFKLGLNAVVPIVVSSDGGVKANASVIAPGGSSGVYIGYDSLDDTGALPTGTHFINFSLSLLDRYPFGEP
mgnify:CR=1 FL=1